MLGRNYKPYYQIRDKYPSYITNLQNSKTRTPISKQEKKKYLKMKTSEAERKPS